MGESAQHHFDKGEKLREEKDYSGALDHFNEALDADPSFPNAFSEIVDILAKNKDWQGLAKNYLAMIDRVPEDDTKTRRSLWKDLGELYRVVFRDLQNAIHAYRTLTSLKPVDPDDWNTLGELLLANQDINEAIFCYHQAIKQSPEQVSSYRNLWKLFNRKEDYDKVLATLAIMVFLGELEEDEEKILKFLSKKAPKEPRRPINAQSWESALVHDDAKSPLRRILNLIYQHAQAMFTMSHSDVGLQRKSDLVRLRLNFSQLSRCFKIASRTMSEVHVELFQKSALESSKQSGLDLVRTNPVGIIAYGNSPDNRLQLLFYLGRLLALAHPDFILAYSLPLDELKALVDGACLIVEPDFNTTADATKAQEAARRLKEVITDTGMKQLEPALREYIGRSVEFDFGRWLEAVEHTANRAGFVVANDLSVSMNIIRDEKSMLTSMNADDKERELLLFAASPQYLQFRKDIGTAWTG